MYEGVSRCPAVRLHMRRFELLKVKVTHAEILP